MGTIIDKLKYLEQTKIGIKDAIFAKGVYIPEGTTFRSYVDKISAIPGGGKVDVGAIGLKCGGSTFNTVPNELDFSNVSDMSQMFVNCRSLTSVILNDISNVTDLSAVFYNCYQLHDITILGNPANLNSVDSVFDGIPQTGVFTYDVNYDYSAFIERLPQGWTSKSSYIPQECISLTITADDVQGGESTAKVSYIAMTNGVDLNGRIFENFEVRGTGISEDFGVNPSTSESRQVTVSFTYLGQTATTTITQGKYVAMGQVLGDYFYYNQDEEDKLKNDIESGNITGVTWEDIVAKNDEIKAAYPDGWAPRVLTNADVMTDYGDAADPLYNFSGVYDIKILPHFDFSNVTSVMNQAFQSSTNNQYVYISDMNLEQCPSMWNLFFNQRSLESVGVIDCGALNEADNGNIDNMFAYCTSLKHVGGLRNTHMATNFVNAYSWDDEWYCPLTRESVLNIFNTMGECTSSERNTWKFHWSVYDLLTPEDIKIATDKGYQVEKVGRQTYTFTNNSNLILGINNVDTGESGNSMIAGTSTTFEPNSHIKLSHYDMNSAGQTGFIIDGVRIPADSIDENSCPVLTIVMDQNKSFDGYYNENTHRLSVESSNDTGLQYYNPPTEQLTTGDVNYGEPVDLPHGTEIKLFAGADVTAFIVNGVRLEAETHYGGMAVNIVMDEDKVVSLEKHIFLDKLPIHFNDTEDYSITIWDMKSGADEVTKPDGFVSLKKNIYKQNEYQFRINIVPVNTFTPTEIVINDETYPIAINEWDEYEREIYWTKYTTNLTVTVNGTK